VNHLIENVEVVLDFDRYKESGLEALTDRAAGPALRQPTPQTVETAIRPRKQGQPHRYSRGDWSRNAPAVPIELSDLQTSVIRTPWCQRARRINARTLARKFA